MWMATGLLRRRVNDIARLHLAFSQKHSRDSTQLNEFGNNKITSMFVHNSKMHARLNNVFSRRDIRRV